MYMDISALKYFIVVAQTEHISRAAEMLHITQPSLSTSIRRLEADVGYSLFDRNGRGIQLNEYGKIYLKAVLQADAAMTRALAEMDELRKSSVNYIRLSCSNSATNTKAIAEMLSKGIHLKLSEVPETWGQELINNRTDLVITMEKSEHPEIAHSILHFRRMVLVVSRNHALASLKNPALADIMRYSFCSTNSSHSMINVIKQQCGDLDFHPRIAFLGRNSDDMVKAIQSGMYVGVMVRRNLPQQEDLVILNVPDFEVYLPIYLYWRESDTDNRELTGVRNHIISFYQSLSAG